MISTNNNNNKTTSSGVRCENSSLLRSGTNLGEWPNFGPKMKSERWRRSVGRSVMVWGKGKGVSLVGGHGHGPTGPTAPTRTPLFSFLIYIYIYIYIVIYFGSGVSVPV